MRHRSTLVILGQILLWTTLPAGAATETRDSKLGQARIVELMDEIREVVQDKTLNIDVPTIVVVGGQSSGKSSVISSLIEMQLPSGDGIVTRAPLRVQIKACPPEELRPHAAISYHTRGKDGKPKLHTMVVDADALQLDPAAVANAILDAQQHMDKKSASEDRVGQTGHAQDLWVYNEAITLEAYRPGANRVTLVDLPGLVSGASGPPEFKEKLEALSRKWTEKPNTVILAVAPLHRDGVATDLGLAFVKKADPKWERSLPVFTNIDNMATVEKEADSRTNAIKAVGKLGAPSYVLVSNHITAIELQQQGIAKGSAAYFKLMRSNEQRELKDFPQAAPGSGGIPALLEKIESMHGKMVEDALPDVQKQLRVELDHVEEKLDKMEQVLSGPEATKKLTKLLVNVHKLYDEACDFNTLSVSTEPGSPNRLGQDLSECAYKFVNNESFHLKTLLSGEKDRMLVELAIASAFHSGGNTIDPQVGSNVLTDILKGASVSAKAFVECAVDRVDATTRGIINNGLAHYPKLHDAVLSKVEASVSAFAKATGLAVQRDVTAYTRVPETAHRIALRQTYKGILQFEFDKSDKGGKPQKASSTKIGPWPHTIMESVPQSAFELLAKSMNCDPSDLIDSLSYNFDRLSALVDEQPEHMRVLSAEQLFDELLSIASMLLSAWHSITETVHTTVRYKFVAPKELPADEHMDDNFRSTLSLDINLMGQGWTQAEKEQLLSHDRADEFIELTDNANKVRDLLAKIKALMHYLASL